MLAPSAPLTLKTRDKKHGEKADGTWAKSPTLAGGLAEEAPSHHGGVGLADPPTRDPNFKRKPCSPAPAHGTPGTPVQPWAGVAVGVLPPNRAVHAVGWREEGEGAGSRLPSAAPGGGPGRGRKPLGSGMLLDFSEDARHRQTRILTRKPLYGHTRVGEMPEETFCSASEKWNGNMYFCF